MKLPIITGIIFVFSLLNLYGKGIFPLDTIDLGELPIGNRYRFLIEAENENNKKLHLIQLKVETEKVLDSLNVFSFSNYDRDNVYSIHNEYESRLYTLFFYHVTELPGFSNTSIKRIGKIIAKYIIENDDKISLDTVYFSYTLAQLKTRIYSNNGSQSRFMICGGNNLIGLDYNILNYTNSVYKIDSVVNRKISGNAEFTLKSLKSGADSVIVKSGSYYYWSSNALSPKNEAIDYISHLQIFLRDTIANESKVISDTLKVYFYPSDPLLFMTYYNFSVAGTSPADTVFINGYPCSSNEIYIEDVKMIGNFQNGSYSFLFNKSSLPMNLNLHQINENKQLKLPVLELEKTHFYYNGAIEIKYRNGVEKSQYRYILFENDGIIPSSVDRDKSECLVYPNPAVNSIFISSEFANSDYSIYDVFGQRLLFGMLDNVQIDISKLQAGTYYINIQQGEKIVNSKFVVIR